MIEPRNKWALHWLSNISRHRLPIPVVGNLLEVYRVLEHGALKHGNHPASNAATHIEHALAHLRRIRIEERENESGLLHKSHAAARCLLAFGDLVGLGK